MQVQVLVHIIRALRDTKEIINTVSATTNTTDDIAYNDKYHHKPLDV